MHQNTPQERQKTFETGSPLEKELSDSIAESYAKARLNGFVPELVGKLSAAIYDVSLSATAEQKEKLRRLVSDLGAGKY